MVELTGLGSASISSAERAVAFQNDIRTRNGYYTSDELIDLAQRIGFELWNPFVPVKRGTSFSAKVTLGSSVEIHGEDVVLETGCELIGSQIFGSRVRVGAHSKLKGAAILGNDVRLGDANRISGRLELDSCQIGHENQIDGLRGHNRGKVMIGSKNRIFEVTVTSFPRTSLRVGNENELCRGLSINNLIEGGRISIGSHNSLGRDGGGVISSAYRFGKRWEGDVIIGSGVETTRGAEVMGFSLLGLNLDALAVQRSKSELVRIFARGKLAEIQMLIDGIWEDESVVASSGEGSKGSVSLFGIVKVKRCLLGRGVVMKDSSFVRSAFIEGAIIPERSGAHQASIRPEAKKEVRVPHQDCVVMGEDVVDETDWKKFKGVYVVEDYPPSDAEFYATRRAISQGA